MNFDVGVGWVAKILALALSFINMRLIIECIGKEGFAAYSIIFSLTAWLSLLNLGLPITVQNSISILRGRKVEHQPMCDLAYGSMLTITLIMTPLVIGLGFFAKAILFASYPSLSYFAVICICLIIFFAAQGQMLIQIMYANHNAFWPNIYPALSAIFMLSALLLAKYFNISDINELLLMIGFTYLLTPLHAFFTLDVVKRAKIDIESTIKKIKEARSQWIFAILSCCTLSIDYIIMSQILDANAIAEYSIASRLFGVVLIMHTVLLMTSWTPLGDLLHSNSKNQAKKLVNQILKRGLFMGAAFGLLTLFSMNWIVSLWTNGQINSLSLALGLSLWIYTMIRIWTDTFSMAMLAFDRASELNNYIPLQAIISAGSAVFLGLFFGSVGVVLGIILSFMLTVVWVLPMKFRRLIEK